MPAHRPGARSRACTASSYAEAATSVVSGNGPSTDRTRRVPSSSASPEAKWAAMSSRASCRAATTSARGARRLAATSASLCASWSKVADRRSAQSAAVEPSSLVASSRIRWRSGSPARTRGARRRLGRSSRSGGSARRGRPHPPYSMNSSHAGSTSPATSRRVPRRQPGARRRTATRGAAEDPDTLASCQRMRMREPEDRGDDAAGGRRGAGLRAQGPARPDGAALVAARHEGSPGRLLPVGVLAGLRR